jgi:hypothetical protein
MPRPSFPLSVASIAIAVSACSGEVPYAVEVVSFLPGPGAGFGQDALPDVVLGPPQGGSPNQGSTHVLSLGQGGAIVLRLGQAAVDGDGPDLIVFENPFAVGGGSAVFGEPGEVAVSSDGSDFVAFPCAPAAPPPNGCAGYGLVHAGSENDIDATDPERAGGDSFDLAEVGLREARYVRITDRGSAAVAPSAGFDLDAVAAVLHPRP